MNRLHRLPRELVELVRKLRCSGKGGLYTFFLDGCFESPSLFRCLPGPFQPKIPETDWDDMPGLPRLAIPVRFRVFPALFGQKTPKRTGMTRLGVSSQSVSAFSQPFSANKPQNGLG